MHASKYATRAVLLALVVVVLVVALPATGVVWCAWTCRSAGVRLRRALAQVWDLRPRKRRVAVAGDDGTIETSAAYAEYAAFPPVRRRSDTWR